MADAVVAAKAGQKTPDGYYNVERMLKRVLAGNGKVLLCGTCMDARGLDDAALMAGARRSTMDELAASTLGGGQGPRVLTDAGASISITTPARRSIRRSPPPCARFWRIISAIRRAGIGLRPQPRPSLRRRAAKSRRLLGCHSDEIVFTSGGSEANNLALKGVFFALRDKGDHIVTTRIEHPAIIEPCRFLERLGARVTYLPVDGIGRVDPEDLSQAITPRTILVSIMHANNEVGTIQPIEECARIAQSTAFSFTPTPPNRSARLQPTSTSSASICFRSPVTRFTRPRVSAPCSFAVACGSSRSSTVPDTRAVDAPERRVRSWPSGSARLASWRAIFRRWIGCAPCATTSGKGCSAGSAIASPSTDIRRIACRTRSMSPSSVGSAPRYWRGSMASPLRRAQHVIPGASTLSPVLEAMGIAPEVGMGAVRFSLGRGTTRDEIGIVIERLADVIAVVG